MTMLYPNLCYNEVYYKESALYEKKLQYQSEIFNNFSLKEGFLIYK